jgi:hypothetical protein
VPESSVIRVLISEEVSSEIFAWSRKVEEDNPHQNLARSPVHRQARCMASMTAADTLERLLDRAGFRLCVWN